MGLLVLQQHDFCFLAVLCSIWDLSSPTRDGTHALQSNPCLLQWKHGVLTGPPEKPLSFFLAKQINFIILFLVSQCVEESSDLLPVSASGKHVHSPHKLNIFALKQDLFFWPNILLLNCHFTELEMTDDLDHYTNTYQVYSKEPQKCHEFLGSPEVINWKQHLQIQSSQSSLDDVIKNLAATKLGKVKQTQCFLYMASEAGKKLATSLLEAKKLSVNVLCILMLTLSTLDPAHAVLVNKLWYFGGNERSQRFIERCIQTFPTSCLLGPEGTPVSWMLMDQTGELRMAGTLPEYRAQGLISYITCVHVQTLNKLGFPLYSHVDKGNHIMQKVCSNMQSILVPCGWNQWNFVPL
uniref:Glycine N-acyltransferase-like protein n=1 Tax=Moschus moschiferus TaxID=68415 RepID=A0A8C6DDJ5_MOSMO